MRHPRTPLLAGLVAVCAAMAAVLGASAAAGLVHDSIHDEYSYVLEDFCDVTGLDVAVDSTLDIQARIGPRGSDGPLYFVSHGRQHEVLTANGTSLTSDAVVNEKDHKITLNPDGTLTVLVLATGNAVLYGPNGNAIARNPGQLRFELLIDEKGTPDPSDDEITRLGNVKGSTGRSDDYCAAAVPALTGSTS
jgi:hypothetical protein